MGNEKENLLRDFRERKNYSLRELSKLCGVAPGNIAKIEKKITVPKAATLEAIMESLELEEHEKLMIRRWVFVKGFTVEAQKKEDNKNILELCNEVFSNQNVGSEDKEKIFIAIQEIYFELKKDKKGI